MESNSSRGASPKWSLFKRGVLDNFYLGYGSSKGSVNFAQKYLFTGSQDDSLNQSQLQEADSELDCNSIQQFQDESSQETFEQNELTDPLAGGTPAEDLDENFGDSDQESFA